jgi:probable O-glycosylation ligase (exosortase A-associated)
VKGLLFVYTLTYGGSVVALFRPFVGLLVYICFAVVRPELLWFYSVPQGNYSRIIALALLVGWLFSGFGSWQFGKATPVLLALLGWWGWMVLSAACAEVPEVAWGLVETQAKIVLPFLVGMTLIRSPGQVRQIAWVVVLSLGYVALEANLNYLTQGAWFILRLRREGFIGFDNNLLSACMAAGTGVALMLAFAENRLWARAVLGLAALLMAHVVMLAFSRGGLLGLLVAGVAAFLVIPRRPYHYLALASALVIALALVGPEVRERFNTTFMEGEERDASAQSRISLARDCFDLMLRYPVLGAGPDHWAVHAHEYGWSPGKAAHNMWAKTGAELGVVGLLLLVAFHGTCLARLFPLTRERSEAREPQLRPLARIAVVGLLGFLTSVTFINGDRLEVGVYVNLIGAATLKLGSMPTDEATEPTDTGDDQALEQPEEEPVATP